MLNLANEADGPISLVKRQRSSHLNMPSTIKTEAQNKYLTAKLKVDENLLLICDKQLQRQLF